MMEGINPLRKHQRRNKKLGTMCFHRHCKLNILKKDGKPYDDVVLDHANPLEVINLEHVKDNTILEHNTTTPKVCEFEVVLPFEITLHERDLENL